MQWQLNKEQEPGGTQRGTQRVLSFSSPQLCTGLKWHCLPRTTGWRVLVPTSLSVPPSQGLRSAFSQSSLFFFHLGQDCSQDVFCPLLEPNPACSQASPCPPSSARAHIASLGFCFLSTVWCPQCMDSSGSNSSQAAPGMQIIKGVRGPDAGSQPCHTLAV